jgi:hypothetical protein
MIPRGVVDGAGPLDRGILHRERERHRRVDRPRAVELPGRRGLERPCEALVAERGRRITSPMASSDEDISGRKPRRVSSGGPESIERMAESIQRMKERGDVDALLAIVEGENSGSTRRTAGGRSPCGQHGDLPRWMTGGSSTPSFAACS